MNVEHYTCRVVCSPEEEAFVATVADFPSLSWIADSWESAQERVTELMVENDRDLRQLGE